MSALRVLVMTLGGVTAVSMAITGWMPTLEGAIVTYGLAGDTLTDRINGTGQGSIYEKFLVIN